MKKENITIFIKREWFKISIILVVLFYIILIHIVRPILERRKFELCMAKHESTFNAMDFDKKALDYCAKEPKIWKHFNLKK